MKRFLPSLHRSNNNNNGNSNTDNQQEYDDVVDSNDNGNDNDHQHQQYHDNYAERNDPSFYLGLQVTVGQKKLKLTKIITISPRYLLINQLDRSVFYQQVSIT